MLRYTCSKELTKASSLKRSSMMRRQARRSIRATDGIARTISSTDSHKNQRGFGRHLGLHAIGRGGYRVVDHMPVFPNSIFADEVRAASREVKRSPRQFFRPSDASAGDDALIAHQLGQPQGQNGEQIGQ